MSYSSKLYFILTKRKKTLLMQSSKSSIKLRNKYIFTCIPASLSKCSLTRNNVNFCIKISWYDVLFINQTFGNILHHFMTVVKIVTAFDLNRVKTTLYTKKYFPEREKRKCFEYLIFWSRDSVSGISTTMEIFKEV